ncbi:helix-turn-helix domain protein (plasmid) [Antarctobacter heliothermus]|uniref:Helix-turn-helix domain protein n=1 Tax=Antarctobacter heliothermus TaxID=74033 RepID=A0A222EBV6_9RHOB|nr:IS30 family transposase [Antarctobacter heliothermus]ASP23622.1 helix-turn-helix domain protein [Antarctobacter heliothermus]
MAHTELDLRERRAIEDMLNAKMPVSKIAAEIGRHRSTVYREIKRNHFTDDELPYLNGYYGMVAQRNASERRARRRKLIRLDALRGHVIDRLKEGWTPEQIAGRLGYDGQPIRISHETIYAYVYSAEGQSEELARHLPSRRKKRQPRYARRPRGQVFPPDRSIHERPYYVKTRETFGEWEGDLMIFERSQGTMNVASLVERKTRFAGISDLEAGNAFLLNFVERYNAKFAKAPRRPDNLHRALNIEPDRLRDILCLRDERYVSQQLAFFYERRRILLEENDVTRGLPGKYMDSYEFPEGRLEFRWKGVSLSPTPPSTRISA